MTYFDYKAVPAPRRVKRQKGVHSAPDLFAITLTDAINEHARQGWEYLRAESLTAETPRRWFRRAVAEDQTVLVFRRPRETLGPRLEAVPGEAPAEPAAGARPVPVDRPAVERLQPARREPRVGEFSETAAPPIPLRREPRLGEIAEVVPGLVPGRTVPQLGPAERS